MPKLFIVTLRGVLFIEMGSVVTKGRVVPQTSQFAFVKTPSRIALFGLVTLLLPVPTNIAVSARFVVTAKSSFARPATPSFVSRAQLILAAVAFVRLQPIARLLTGVGLPRATAQKFRAVFLTGPAFGVTSMAQVTKKCFQGKGRQTGRGAEDSY